jgi:subtilisin family serine protease
MRAVVLALLLVALLPGPSRAQPPGYLDRGRPIALAHSDEFSSVRYAARAGRAAGPATQTSSQGPLALVEIDVVPSVTLVSVHAVTPAASFDVPQAAREVRAELRADPSVLWVYPGLVHPPTGQRLLLTDEIVLKVRAGISVTVVASLLPGSLKFSRPLSGADGEVIVALVTPKASDPLAVAGALATEPWVEWAHPNFVREYTPAAVPDDPLFPEQWHLSNRGQGGGTPGADADVVAAWDVTTGDPGIVIAIIDDGVLHAHPDLAPNLWANPGEVPGSGVDGDGNGFVEDVHGWDFVRNLNDTNPSGDRDSHGTWAAGVAAARGGNGVGVAGACPRCRILPVKVFHGLFFASDAAAAAALRYAARHADVLSNSWGGGAPSPVIASAIEFAATEGRGGKGAPVLFAAANSGSGYLSANLDGLTSFTVPEGTWIYEWTYLKNAGGRRGFDTAWLDNVAFPDGAVETFEACRGLPAGWSTTGDAAWRIVDDPTRASSLRGGRCAAQAGTIGDDQTTALRVERAGPAGTLAFNAWVSAETLDGGDRYTTRCADGLYLSRYSAAGELVFRSPTICGHQSNQGGPLLDGVLAYPASDRHAIVVGASTNFDARADYSQWGENLLVMAPASGGSLRVTTTSGPLTAYTSAFGGTSAATALAAGVVGLLLSREPSLTEGEVRARLRAGTRKIGGVPDDGDGRNDIYGYGVLSARLLLDPAASLAYELYSAGPVVLAPGTRGATRIMAALTGEAAGPVSLTVSGLPSGARADLDPGACAVPCAATLTITTAPSTPLGTYAVTVTGQPLDRRTTFTLVVARPR